MVYSTGSVSASEQSAITARDAPIFIARNVLLDRNVTPQIRTGGSWAAGADVSLANYPATNAADGHGDVPSQPALQGPAVSDYYWLFDLVEAPGGAQNRIDCLAILGHNFGLFAGITITVQIANDNAFTSGLVTLATWSPANNRRLVSYSLNAYTYYQNVRYLRVRVQGAAAFAATQPQIGEIVAGRRRQMGRKPNRPWDPTRMRTDRTLFRAEGGAITAYDRAEGIAELLARWTPQNGTEPATGLDDVATLKAIYRDTMRGRRAFIFADSPRDDAQRAFFVMLDPPELALPEVDYNLAEAELSMVEQTPLLDAEVNG